METNLGCVQTARPYFVRYRGLHQNTGIGGQEYLVQSFVLPTQAKSRTIKGLWNARKLEPIALFDDKLANEITYFAPQTLDRRWIVGGHNGLLDSLVLEQERLVCMKVLKADCKQ
jgi:hypothetical protein